MFLDYSVTMYFLIFQLLELLIEHKLCSLSGTAQRQLISLLEDALNNGEWAVLRLGGLCAY